ncbi:MAG: L-serine ammonia-lyase, iron-sulfur-dependent, subunit alpha, partial [Candidatus Omnitrophota bacterium]
GIDRKQVSVLVGGGAVLDMAGFAMSILHRGVRHIRIPSTLLAQIDAGIGTKNAVNFIGQKNFLGVFRTPKIVIVDSSLLSTLSVRQMVAGMAEAVKVSLIKNKVLFELIETNYQDVLRKDSLPESKMQEIMWLTIIAHLEQIHTDPYELELARPLDYGHEWGHRLEMVTNHRLNHGEAVGIGMAIDSYISYKRGYISEKELERILTVLEAIGLPIYDIGITVGAIWPGLESFRRHLGVELTISLLDGIGKKQDVHEINKIEVSSALGYLMNREMRRRIPAHIAIDKPTTPIVIRDIIACSRPKKEPYEPKNNLPPIIRDYIVRDKPFDNGGLPMPIENNAYPFTVSSGKHRMLATRFGEKDLGKVTLRKDLTGRYRVFQVSHVEYPVSDIDTDYIAELINARKGFLINAPPQLTLNFTLDSEKLKGTSKGKIYLAAAETLTSTINLHPLLCFTPEIIQEDALFHQINSIKKNPSRDSLSANLDYWVKSPAEKLSSFLELARLLSGHIDNEYKSGLLKTALARNYLIRILANLTDMSVEDIAVMFIRRGLSFFDLKGIGIPLKKSLNIILDNFCIYHFSCDPQDRGLPIVVVFDQGNENGFLFLIEIEQEYPGNWSIDYDPEVGYIVAGGVISQGSEVDENIRNSVSLLKDTDYVGALMYGGRGNNFFDNGIEGFFFAPILLSDASASSIEIGANMNSLLLFVPAFLICSFVLIGFHFIRALWRRYYRSIIVSSSKYPEVLIRNFEDDVEPFIRGQDYSLAVKLPEKALDCKTRKALRNLPAWVKTKEDIVVYSLMELTKNLVHNGNYIWPGKPLKASFKKRAGKLVAIFSNPLPNEGFNFDEASQFGFTTWPNKRDIVAGWGQGLFRVRAFFEKSIVAGQMTVRSGDKLWVVTNEGIRLTSVPFQKKVTIKVEVYLSAVSNGIADKNRAKALLRSQSKQISLDNGGTVPQLRIVSIGGMFEAFCGPSSSHTAGANKIGRAAREFIESNHLKIGQLLGIKVVLYSSFATTGQGHQTPQALMGGLLGVTMDDNSLKDAAENAGIKETELRKDAVGKYEGFVSIAGFDIPFVLESDTETSVNHPNTAIVVVQGKNKIIKIVGESLGAAKIFAKAHVEDESGNIIEELGVVSEHQGKAKALDPHDFTKAGELFSLANAAGKRIFDVVLEKEIENMGSKQAVYSFQEELVGTMFRSIERGLVCRESTLARYAGDVSCRFKKYLEDNNQFDDWYVRAALYAISVSEENARGRLIVGAPTGGSCGVVPGVLYSFCEAKKKLGQTVEKEKLIEALFFAQVIGRIVQVNYTLAGAKGGCQAEIGAATAMAAGALMYLEGGNDEQIFNAASFGLLHWLGATCEPAKGYVEVPCIDRNGLAAALAVLSVFKALTFKGIIDFDSVVEKVKQAGDCMPQMFREDSRGALGTFRDKSLAKMIGVSRTLWEKSEKFRGQKSKTMHKWVKQKPRLEQIRNEDVFDLRCERPEFDGFSLRPLFYADCLELINISGLPFNQLDLFPEEIRKFGNAICLAITDITTDFKLNLTALTSMLRHIFSRVDYFKINVRSRMAVCSGFSAGLSAYILGAEKFDEISRAITMAITNMLGSTYHVEPNFRELRDAALMSSHLAALVSLSGRNYPIELHFAAGSVEMINGVSNSSHSKENGDTGSFDNGGQTMRHAMPGTGNSAGFFMPASNNLWDALIERQEGIVKALEERANQLDNADPYYSRLYRKSAATEQERLAAFLSYRVSNTPSTSNKQSNLLSLENDGNFSKAEPGISIVSPEFTKESLDNGGFNRKPFDVSPKEVLHHLSDAPNREYNGRLGEREVVSYHGKLVMAPVPELFYHGTSSQRVKDMIFESDGFLNPQPEEDHLGAIKYFTYLDSRGETANIHAFAQGAVHRFGGRPVILKFKQIDLSSHNIPVSPGSLDLFIKDLLTGEYRYVFDAKKGDMYIKVGRWDGYDYTCLPIPLFLLAEDSKKQLIEALKQDARDKDVNLSEEELAVIYRALYATGIKKYRVVFSLDNGGSRQTSKKEVDRTKNLFESLDNGGKKIGAPDEAAQQLWNLWRQGITVVFDQKSERGQALKKRLVNERGFASNRVQVFTAQGYAIMAIKEGELPPITLAVNNLANIPAKPAGPGGRMAFSLRSSHVAPGFSVLNGAGKLTVDNILTRLDIYVESRVARRGGRNENEDESFLDNGGFSNNGLRVGEVRPFSKRYIEQAQNSLESGVNRLWLSIFPFYRHGCEAACQKIQEKFVRNDPFDMQGVIVGNTIELARFSKDFLVKCSSDIS